MLGVALAPAGDRVGEPAAVATGRAEPGEALLEHDDPQVGLGALEVVRGPQAGVAGADDRDVDVEVAVEAGRSGGPRRRHHGRRRRARRHQTATPSPFDRRPAMPERRESADPARFVCTRAMTSGPSGTVCGLASPGRRSSRQRRKRPAARAGVGARAPRNEPGSRTTTGRAEHPLGEREARAHGVPVHAERAGGRLVRAVAVEPGPQRLDEVRARAASWCDERRELGRGERARVVGQRRRARPTARRSANAVTGAGAAVAGDARLLRPRPRTRRSRSGPRRRSARRSARRPRRSGSRVACGHDEHEPVVAATEEQRRRAARRRAARAARRSPSTRDAAASVTATTTGAARQRPPQLARDAPGERRVAGEERLHEAGAQRAARAARAPAAARARAPPSR